MGTIKRSRSHKEDSVMSRKKSMGLGEWLVVAFVVGCIITKIIVVVRHFYF